MAATSVFLYADLADTLLAGPLEHMPLTRNAWVRGSLWRGLRPLRMLVPGGDQRIPGVLVQLDEHQLPVLDLLLLGPGIRRDAVSSSVGLRPTPAQSWILPDPKVARREGFRPTRRPM